MGHSTVAGRTLASLRSAAGLTRQDLATLLGHKDRSKVAHFENGTRVLTGDHLLEIATQLGVPPEGVGLLQLAHRTLLHGREATGGGTGPLAPTAEEHWDVTRTGLAGAWTLYESLTPMLLARKRARKAARALRQADRQWAWLSKVWRQAGRDLVLVDPRLRTPALAARICDASERAAANNVDDALALARFALFVAEQVPEEDRRARAVGYCRGFVANALRVGEKLDAADAELGRAREQWETGADSEPEILPEWRLPDLETSLRRDQGRFQEALACNERALAQCGGVPVAAGRILLKKANICDAMGDTPGALAALTSAAPFVEATGAARQRFGLRFKIASIYCGLQRYREAAGVLTSVRNMAIEQANTLDLIRVTWLTAKLDAGEGRSLAAIAGLEQVCRDLDAQQLPMEVALASLDLAVVLLEAGRPAEVKKLAIAMEKIFAARGFLREAVAALTLFCEAAKQEAATVELTRWVISEVENARRRATPAKEQEWPRPELG